MILRTPYATVVRTLERPAKMTKGGNAMQIWNRVFLMEPGRQAEATGALVAVHEAINAVSDYGYNLWETVVGTQGEYGASALVPDIEAFTSGALMHDDADGEALGALAAAVNDCVDERSEDSFWNVAHVLGEWSEVPAYVTNIFHRPPLEQLGPLAGASIGVAERFHEVTGAPITVCTSVMGTGPSVRLIVGWDSLADWAAETARGMTDSGFQERLGTAAAIPGVTLMAESNVMRRLG